MADDKWGGKLMVIIILKDDYKNEVSVINLQAYFMAYVENGKISKYAVPKKIEIVNNIIAKTSVGKFNKKAFRILYV
jgi:fatty-acyl-CoA synthase